MVRGEWSMGVPSLVMRRVLSHLVGKAEVLVVVVGELGLTGGNCGPCLVGDCWWWGERVGEDWKRSGLGSGGWRGRFCGREGSRAGVVVRMILRRESLSSSATWVVTVSTF